ncbi:hypothetical protein I3215_08630 [Streptomyces sp. RB110-1]|uniref:hypothetical protein n=1 Tax=unclassified Streptomyces TaxID=2593676 RepID=UPI0019015AF7|nr:MULTISPECIES: hypothetical protein [unclassified Streptomyces]MBK0372957.1 hypothetical protein [Streptomyces sp. RB110-1]MBK0390675.1 hypothetical protein [Streptomyces sp. RB110-2]
MATTSTETAEQEPVGGFVTDPTDAVGTSQGGCCGEPADATGAVVGGQGDGCCGEPGGGC